MPKRWRGVVWLSSPPPINRHFPLANTWRRGVAREGLLGQRVCQFQAGLNLSEINHQFPDKLDSCQEKKKAFPPCSLCLDVLPCHLVSVWLIFSTSGFQPQLVTLAGSYCNLELRDLTTSWTLSSPTPSPSFFKVFFPSCPFWIPPGFLWNTSATVRAEA